MVYARFKALSRTEQFMFWTSYCSQILSLHSKIFSSKKFFSLPLKNFPIIANMVVQIFWVNHAYFDSYLTYDILSIIITIALYTSLKNISRYTQALSTDGFETSKLTINLQILSLALATILRCIFDIILTVGKSDKLD